MYYSIRYFSWKTKYWLFVGNLFILQILAAEMHILTRRSNSLYRHQNSLLVLICQASSAVSIIEPKILSEVENNINRDEWMAAAKCEFQSPLDNDTWKLC